MTKIALITDTHWGVRNDNTAILDMSKRFLDDVFFKELDKQDIKHIIHLGDLVDRRKQINIQTAKRLREDFIIPILERNIDYHQILGNHDVYYKSTNKVNAVQEMYGELISWYDTATELTINDIPLLLVPWICSDNKDESYKAIQASRSNFCLGHLEIIGFEMYRGSISTHGDSRNLFDKFDLTLSGHYHHKSTDGSIHYLGSHGQFTWSDYGDERGFHILDLNTRGLTFYENPYKMFTKVHYDDESKTLNELMDYNFDLCKSTYVKVIVRNKTNPYWFDKFCERIEKVGVIDMQIVDDHLNLNLEDDSDIVNEAESTIDIFRKHIAKLPQANFNKTKLETLVVELYNQALTVE